MAPKPPTIVDLTWIGELKFSATTDKASLTLDSAGLDGPSPIQALAAALSSCMAADITHILIRARHPLRALRSRLVADRAGQNPRRLVRVALHFFIEGAVPPHAVERAVALSRDKYCSVWHSMRHDIPFEVTFEVKGH